eukprot:2393615-Lingulodinium_polyedra.AAC.1
MNFLFRCPVTSNGGRPPVWGNCATPGLTAVPRGVHSDRVGCAGIRAGNCSLPAHPVETIPACAETPGLPR